MWSQGRIQPPTARTSFPLAVPLLPDRLERSRERERERWGEATGRRSRYSRKIISAKGEREPLRSAFHCASVPISPLRLPVRGRDLPRAGVACFPASASAIGGRHPGSPTAVASKGGIHRDSDRRLVIVRRPCRHQTNGQQRGPTPADTYMRGYVRSDPREIKREGRRGAEEGRGLGHMLRGYRCRFILLPRLRSPAPSPFGPPAFEPTLSAVRSGSSPFRSPSSCSSFHSSAHPSRPPLRRCFVHKFFPPPGTPLLVVVLDVIVVVVFVVVRRRSADERGSACVCVRSRRVRVKV
jgi:hypothetical protein